MPVSGEEALRRLQVGNSRFRQEPSGNGPSGERHARFLDLSAGQQPFAAVLACSDSRVPVEMIFDRGPGDLFVVRVAGNVVGPTQLGSLEFAVGVLGVRLILVMGHTGCGAVAAALAQELCSESGMFAFNLAQITRRISMALDGCGQSERTSNEPLSGEAERLHAGAVAKELVQRSELLDSSVRSGELLIAGSIYDLKTGQVEFFDEAGITLTGGGSIQEGPRKRSERDGAASAIVS
jgi:carbonic anhydrase